MKRLHPGGDRRMLRFMILVLLSDGEAKHGYALMKAFGRRSGLRLSMANVYRELQRLREAGLVVRTVGLPDADPRRVPYAITARGRQALAVWLAEPASNVPRAAPDSLSYRLVALEEMECEQAFRFLDDLRETLEMELKVLDKRHRVLRPEGGLHATDVLAQREALHLQVDLRIVGEARARLDACRRPRAGKPSSGADAPTPSRSISPRVKGGAAAASRASSSSR
jgi:DNA-binding PadR family transcriptional regulator